MRIPHVISRNTIKAYETSNIFNNRQAKIRSDNYNWSDKKAENLRILCLLAIAKYWEKFPLYDELTFPRDKSVLLELLPTTLPLELTIPIIQEDYYWERCFQAYWPDSAPPNRRYQYEKLISFVGESESNTEELFLPESTVSDKEELIEFVKPGKISNEDSFNSIGKYDSTTELSASCNSANNYVIILKSWKQCVLERYVAEVLEKMTPDIFHEEYIQTLTNLHKDYILSLNLTQLQSSKNKNSNDHISLYTLLSDLPNLIEICVCFNQADLVDEFSWHHLQVSDADCHNFGKGVMKSNIEILRILHSNIDCRKVKLLVRNLEVHCTLRVLDFSHCKIGDEGALCIAAVLMKNPTIDTVILLNNKIGVKGAQGLGYYLCQPQCRLLKLNLKLNALGVEGGAFIATGLAKGAKTLNHLSLSSCGLTEENFPFGMVLSLNNSLQTLDLSNNKLGEEPGHIILEKIKLNSTLFHIDLRLCNIPQNIVIEINKVVHSNLMKYRGAPLKSPPYIEDLM